MIKFGTDGWRGVIGDDFTFENVRIVSQAIASFLKRTAKEKKRVVIGFDRRFLSESFAREVGCVLAANKIKTIISSCDVPTPVVSFHCLYKKYDLGIMITASHNPAQFNGIKIKTKEGGAADKFLTNKVESLLYKGKPRKISYQAAIKSGFLKQKGLTADYIKFLRNFFKVNKIRKLKMRLLVDTMHGVGNGYIEQVLGSSQMHIDYLHNDFNPSFAGIRPEPIEENLQSLIKKVKTKRYDLGIAIDGDGDRLAVVNKDGSFLTAQILLPLLALHMVKNKGQRKGIGKTIVGSNLIDKVSLSLGVPCYQTPVGFKYISNLFSQNLISIGGEEAGGIGFAGYIPERDGTASSLMLLEMIAAEGKSLDRLLKELWAKFGRWYYQRTAFPIRKKIKSMDNIKLPRELLGSKIERINRSDGIKLITKRGWLMFRKSGTEPVVRVYAEGRTKRETSALIDLGKKIIQAS